MVASMLSLLLPILIILGNVIEAIDHPEEFVNLLSGTFTEGNVFSTGNTLPLVGRPWGFNHWAPQTRDEKGESWWFHGSDHIFTWIRCTHQPSPWIGDWGYFLFSPQIGHTDRNPNHYWEPRGATLKPYLMDFTVAPNLIRIQLVPTDHAAIVRITFPNTNDHDYGGKSVCFANAEWKSHGSISFSNGGQYFTGMATQVHSERMLVANFRLFIRVESDEAERINFSSDMICLMFRNEATIVSMRISTSLISFDQAQINMDREVPSKKTFETIALDTKMVWNKILKRVDVIDSGELSGTTTKWLTIFYSCLYRALMFPRRIDEVSSSGEQIHYSPYDGHGRQYPGPLLTDNGFWDTYRTVYPLLNLLYPDHSGVIVQGWLNAFKEGGWLPSWASPGYRNCMAGTYADVVVADAIVKGIKGFELDVARDAILRDSFDNPPPFSGGAVGKDGLEEYKRLGYLSSSHEEGSNDAVSRTLDYGFADFAVAQALMVLVHQESSSDPSQVAGQKKELLGKAEGLLQRSNRAMMALFDKSSGLMIPKTAEGRKVRNFSPIEWGKGYTEGNAWHHSFPPYGFFYSDPIPSRDSFNPLMMRSTKYTGLVELHGGKENLLKKLKNLLEVPSNFRVGSYGTEIHEMTEMRALAMGQYGHNNQPSHHLLYLFALLGDRATTETTTRKVLNHAYGVDFYAGDEDNGEMSAWFVLSALGLYVPVPGTSHYVLGSPIFRHVRISRYDLVYDNYYDRSYEDSVAASNPSKKKPGGEKYLDIVALGTSVDRELVESVYLNNNLVEGAEIDHDSLDGEGVLRFIMVGERKPTSQVISKSLIDDIRAGVLEPLDLGQSILKVKVKVSVHDVHHSNRSNGLIGSSGLDHHAVVSPVDPPPSNLIDAFQRMKGIIEALPILSYLLCLFLIVSTVLLCGWKLLDNFQSSCGIASPSSSFHYRPNSPWSIQQVFTLGTICCQYLSYFVQTMYKRHVLGQWNQNELPFRWNNSKPMSHIV